MYIVESSHGITIDAGNNIPELIAAHKRSNNTPANIYKIEAGIKSLVECIEGVFKWPSITLETDINDKAI